MIMFGLFFLFFYLLTHLLRLLKTLVESFREADGWSGLVIAADKPGQEVSQYTEAVL